MNTIHRSHLGWGNFFTKMPNICLRVFLVIFLFFGAGCSQLELPRAFQGEFSSQRNNKLISEYCTSCHIHKVFDSKQHVSMVRAEYKRSLFRKTTECRVCHYLEKQWTRNGVLRKTRRPREVNRGYFRKFEKEYKSISKKSR